MSAVGVWVPRLSDTRDQLWLALNVKGSREQGGPP